MPALYFFCELDAAPLAALFDGQTIINQLKAIPAGVALALRDLSDERADVVRRLNAAGIPVAAWLLLPRDQGYWFNADNARHAAAAYDAFRTWTHQHGLRWEAVGLDIEPNHDATDMLMREGTKGMLSLLRRLRPADTIRQAQADYYALAKRARADGYRVDAYHLMLIEDERRAGSLLFQRILGIVDFPADREVLMLYSSFLGDLGPGMLWSYGADAQAIGVGSTGGGVEIGDLPTRILSWDQLVRDLRYAHAHTDAIYVFSLEGSVKQGYLPRLSGFDWNAPFTLPDEALRRVIWARRGVFVLLWAWAHPGLVAVGLWLIVEQVLRWTLWRRARRAR